jgi:XTP/dITP diphosphohydrolase
MPRLVIATNNPGKLREFERLLDGSGFDLISPRDAGVPDWTVEETGTTFEANAILKAEDAARATGLPALADDSGLEVDALGGRPGVFSARYAGKDMLSNTITEAEQRRLILEEMAGVPDARRTARFRCVIAIAAPGTETLTVDGVMEGRVAHQERGTNGFGYDAIFFEPAHGRTSAELSPAEKDALSHRGQAARKAVTLLKALAAQDTTK